MMVTTAAPARIGVHGTLMANDWPAGIEAIIRLANQTFDPVVLRKKDTLTFVASWLPTLRMVAATVVVSFLTGLDGEKVTSLAKIATSDR